MAELSVTRRRFLIASGWTAAGVTVIYFGGRSVLSGLPSFELPDAEAAASWLQIGGDGRCRMFCPRAEMGQNASIGLAQIAAEELGIAVEEIEMRFPNTREISQNVITAGSMSLALFAEPTARAAAALRELMRARAATSAGVDLTAVENGINGFLLPEGRSLSYADLAGGEVVVLDRVDEAPLYSFDSAYPHTQIGRSAPPYQLEEIAVGAALFAADMRLPEMLYGRMVRPVARNARLVHVDDTRAKSIAGVVQVVADLDRDFVGVVCETPGKLDAAIEALEVEWQLPTRFDQQTIDELIDVDAALARGDLEHTVASDRFDPEPAWDLELRFEVQLQSHAMQEPRAALAQVVPASQADGQESAEIWTGSQDLFVIQRHAARDLGIAKHRVCVHALRIGGGFGGREHYDVERDAVRLSRAVGRPVKVQWSREDEFRGARNRPASSHRIKLAADDEGRLTDWWHAFVSGHIVFARERLPDWMLPAVRLLGDLGVARGGSPPYRAQRKRIEFGDIDLPVDLGTWRSLGAAPNSFVIESAIDELARLRGVDPVELRLQNIAPEHERLVACLRRTRELAEGRPLPAGSNLGRGYACGIYEEHSFVAASADVRVDESTGAVQVLRMCCVQDVGLAVNPDQLRAQIEGNLIWGLGMALRERVEIGDSDIASLNFDRYRIPSIEDAPEFEIEIISPRDIPPAGAGETALIVAPPAIANALRDATGHRYTALPIRPDPLL